MGENHAVLSPSGADKWMECAASLAQEHGQPNPETDYAAQGTAAHDLAARCLIQRKKALAFLNTRITVGNRSFYVRNRDSKDAVDAGAVQVYLDNFMEYAGDNPFLVEHRVDFSRYVGYSGSFGTSDGMIFLPGELQVHDLKFGAGVKVSAIENRQMRLYALGALDKFGLVDDFHTVRMVIHQPRISKKPSEWSCSVPELLAFGEEAREAAITAMTLLEDKKAGMKPDISTYNPGGKQCKFCRGKRTCPAQLAGIARVLEASLDDFDDETEGEKQ